MLSSRVPILDQSKFHTIKSKGVQQVRLRLGIPTRQATQYSYVRKLAHIVPIQCSGEIQRPQSQTWQLIKLLRSLKELVKLSSNPESIGDEEICRKGENEDSQLEGKNGRGRPGY